MKTRIRYNVKVPGKGGAAHFYVFKDVLGPDGKRDVTKVEDERIDALNRLVDSGAKSQAVAEVEIRRMVDAWKKADRARLGEQTFNEDNRALLDAYWRDSYSHRDLIDSRSAKDRLVRAIEAVGQLSLTSASREELQKAVNTRFRGDKQRARIAALNQLLRFAGRNIKLSPAKRERKRVAHLSTADFGKVMRHVEDTTLRLFYIAAFATGGRVGEVLALSPERVRGDLVFIDSQVDNDGLERSTKNRRERHALIHPEWGAEVKTWAALPQVERLPCRRDDLGDVIKAVCQRLWPNEPLKHCTAKDLRHSYAIWLLSRGVSLSLVAQSLGNSIAVCQENYGGFVLAPDSIQAIRSILGAPVAK